MKTIIRVVAVFLSGCLLVGCSTKAYVPTEIDSPDHGTVTLIRINAEPTATRLTIYADDKKVAALANNSTVTFSLPVGVRKLSMGWSNTGSYFEDKIRLNLKGRDHYYYAVTHYFEVSDVKNTPRRQEWTNSELVTYVEMDKESAEKLIKDQEL